MSQSLKGGRTGRHQKKLPQSENPPPHAKEDLTIMKNRIFKQA
jgi:hypothetical protein